MKTIKTFAVATAALLISVTISASTSLPKDDTIRIKTQDNSEMIVVINNFNDFENLGVELEAVMKNLGVVFSEMQSEMDGLDSVINISVKNIDNELKVDIQGRDGEEDRIINLNYDLNEEQKAEKKFQPFFSYDLGFNNYLENGKFPNDVNAQYSVKPWGSWDFGIGGGLRWYVAKPFSIDFGANFSWFNYKYQDRSTRVIKTDDDVLFTSDGAGAEYLKSKMAVPYLNVNITPMVHFGKKNTGVNHRDFRIGAGVYAGYRLGGSVKYVYNLSDIHMKYRTEGDFFLSTYRYGVKAVFGFKDINLFATYDLSTLYAEGKGPELNPICFGLNWTF